MNLATESLAADGRTRALENAEPAWRDRAMDALKKEAESGNRFEAYTLEVLHDVPAPENPNVWGGLFRDAAQKRLIRPVDYQPSLRPSRRGGRCLHWVGAA